MSYHDMKQELAAQVRAGDMTLDEYEVELAALEYERGERESAQDDDRGMTA